MVIGHLGAGDWGPSRIESAQHLPFDEVGFAGGARGRRFRPLSEWPAIRPEGQMGAPLECSMCGIRWLHLCASIRFQPPAFFIVLRAQGRPHIVREVDHQSSPYKARRISAAFEASAVRLPPSAIACAELLRPRPARAASTCWYTLLQLGRGLIVPQSCQRINSGRSPCRRKPGENRGA